MKVFPLLAAAPLAALVAACQYGEANMPVLADDVPHTFLALDADRDGFISRPEATPAVRLARNFQRADVNGDGMLNRYEFNSPGWRPFPGEPD